MNNKGICASDNNVNDCRSNLDIIILFVCNPLIQNKGESKQGRAIFCFYIWGSKLRTKTYSAFKLFILSYSKQH